MLQRQLKPGLAAAQAERFRETAARVLSRLEMTGAAALPQELEALAKAIVLAPTIERAEALASELRLAVQRQSETQHAQRAEAEEARRLLEELPRGRAGAAIARAGTCRGRRRTHGCGTTRCRATDARQRGRGSRTERAGSRALVLQESLRDLGYEVEDIEATLFVDGGAVHFRRAGWDNYFVRLRLNPREHTVNFNVVRASGDEETAERRRLDALAEDRWCSEFPRVLQTLAARGLDLDVTRRLEAGEVPVQVVDRAGLPASRRRTIGASAPGAARTRQAVGDAGLPCGRHAALDHRSEAAAADPVAVRRRRQYPRQLSHALRTGYDARAAAALPLGAPRAARLPVPAGVRSGRGPATVSEPAGGSGARDQALRPEARGRRDADEPREPDRRSCARWRVSAKRAARSSSISRRG